MNREKSFAASVRGYVIGLLLSLGLTGLVYCLVVLKAANVTMLAAIVLALGIAQLLVQSKYFLHLADEARPRWKRYSYIFSLLMVLIIVVEYTETPLACLLGEVNQFAKLALRL